MTDHVTSQSNSSVPENPFSDSDVIPVELGNDEQFVGDELKAFFDKEEKMYQSTLSVKSDGGEKSNGMASGLTMRSFMIDSGDSDLIHQKLTMSQYIAYRSEPLGHLGDSCSSTERPYFSFQEASESPNEKSEAGVLDFDPDFSQEPSWLKKKSLSSLSSSENLEIPKSPDCSENWLLGNKSTSLAKCSSDSSNAVCPQDCNQNQIKSDERPDEVSKTSVIDQNKNQVSVSEISLGRFSEIRDAGSENLLDSRKISMSYSSSQYQPNHQPPTEASGLKNRVDSDCESSEIPQYPVDESAAYKADEEEDESPIVPSLLPPEPGDVSELPSLYWRPHANESKVDFGQSQLDVGPEKAASQCHSYVAGHVESLSYGVNGIGGGSSKRLSDIAASSQSSSSPASTIRENIEFQRCESLCVSVSEPQLSSTREITDDCIELGLSVKRVHFLKDTRPAEQLLSKMSSQQARPFEEKPNLCSTARNHSTVTPTASLEANGSSAATPAASVNGASQKKISEPNKEPLEKESSKALGQPNQEWVNTSQNITGPNDRSAFTPESWLAVFSNTSALSTPLLMNKIKEHVMRQQGRGMSSAHVTPSESSGIGGSGFEITDITDRQSGQNLSSLLKSHSRTGMSIPTMSAIDSSASSPVTVKPEKPNPGEVATSMPSAASIRQSPAGRHTLAALPVQFSEPITGIRSETPIDDEAKMDFKENGFTRLTSTVMKKVPAPENTSGSSAVLPQAKGNVSVKRPMSLSNAPVVKCNRSHVHFGGSKVRQTQKQSLVIRNSSFKDGLDLELRIKDSEDFYIIDMEQSLVSRFQIHLDARQERLVELVFRPRSLGPVASKLNLYPRCETAKKVKYTVDLSGYGGSSQIRIGPDSVLAPKCNGTYWSCRIFLENRGNVDGFACLQPFREDGTLMDLSECVVLPQCGWVNAGDVKEVQVFIHPAKNKKPSSFKLQLYWGDAPLLTRWTKCISKGISPNCPDELRSIDWTKLLQLGCSNGSVEGEVGEEDRELLYGNITTEELCVLFQDASQDSKFVTLAMETVTDTVLEPSSLAMSSQASSQRRVTTAGCGKPSTSACISAGITELVFPSTRIGSVSAQKIPLQNWSSTNQEVRVKQINGPFKMLHARSVVPGGFYTRLPIQFQPIKPGPQSGSVVLEAGNPSQLLVITLRGEAF